MAISTIHIQTIENGNFDLQLSTKVTLSSLQEALTKEYEEYKEDISMFIHGEPVLENTEIKDNDEVFVLSNTPAYNEKQKLFPKTTMKDIQVKTEEPPLNDDEIQQIYNLLTPEQRGSIEMITEMGFDVMNSFKTYCSCRGDVESAVNMMLLGGGVANYKNITTYIVRNYPDAVRQVRPALLEQRGSTQFNTPGNGERNLEEMFYRALASGRLRELLGVC